MAIDTAAFLREPNLDTIVEDVRTALESYYDPQTPSHELSLRSLRNARQMLSHTLREHESLYAQIRPLLYSARRHLFAVGYRDNIWTQQEHRLLGLKMVPVHSPYVPLGVALGLLTVPDAQRARALEHFTYALPAHYGLAADADVVHVSLEPLDRYGLTVADPQLLDEQLQPVYSQRSVQFPYARSLLDVHVDARSRQKAKA